MTGSVLFVGRRFWREGQMKAIVSFVCLLLAATCAAEESHVTVSTGGWVGSGVTNGWRFANLGAGGMMGARSFIESPRWPEAVVLTVTIGLSCTTNLPNRFVQVTFLYDDDLPTRAIRVGAVERAGCRECQSFDSNPDRIARGVRIDLSDGDVGDWRIEDVTLDFQRASRLPHAERGFKILIS